MTDCYKNTDDAYDFKKIELKQEKRSDREGTLVLVAL
jgi:hypothetical protein